MKPNEKATAKAASSKKTSLKVPVGKTSATMVSPKLAANHNETLLTL
jgi:hypothetical protein